MNVSQERTRSPWMEVEVFPAARRIAGDLEADAVVIGSGIAGLSCAYELLRRGRHVTVLDRGAIGSGMTARTTAHLSAISDDGFAEFIRRRGEEMARLFHESHATAIARIAQIVEAHAIDCRFRRLDGVLFAADAKGEHKIGEELEAAQRLGIPVIAEHGMPFEGARQAAALRYPGQATFHPALYLKGLAAALAAEGVRFFAETAVASVEEDEGGVTVKTLDDHTLRARLAVVATNSPVNDFVAVHTKQAPYRTYAMALDIAAGTLPDGLHWDTRDPYHHVRLEKGEGNDLLIVGGEDHKSGEADDGAERFDLLEDWTRAHVPQAGRVTHRWSGQVLEPVDYAGFIGLNPGNRNIYVATGDSGQGMTHGVVAGLLIAELATGAEHRWQALYEPSRKITRGLGEYVSENLTAAKSFAEYLARGEVASTREVKRGEGAILREGLHLVAVARDEDGTLHRRSAACTHAGCVVHWNSTERCWDCPCHGSQFAPDGTALNGPAVKPLPPAD